MIVGELKPIEEIVATISDFRNIRVPRLRGCVSVCLTGGDRQAHALARDLDIPAIMHQRCRILRWIPSSASANRTYPVFFDLTRGYGRRVEPGLRGRGADHGRRTRPAARDSRPEYHVHGVQHRARCVAGDVPGVRRLHAGLHRGICPIARCAKSLFNGPCGGSKNGSCEVRKDMPCAWALIYYKLKKQNQLHVMMLSDSPGTGSRPAGTGPGNWSVRSTPPFSTGA